MAGAAPTVTHWKVDTGFGVPTRAGALCALIEGPVLVVVERLLRGNGRKGERGECGGTARPMHSAAAKEAREAWSVERVGAQRAMRGQAQGRKLARVGQHTHWTTSRI